MTCVFCSIVQGTSPSHVIWEDKQYLAFLSIFPNTEGFSVVIPKKHLSSYIFDQKNDDITGLILASKKVVNILDNFFPKVGRTGMIFEGYGIDHLHCKLFPMHGTKDDSSFKKISSSVDKFFIHYEGYISSHDYKRADDPMLGELAKKIRNSY